MQFVNYMYVPRYILTMDESHISSLVGTRQKAMDSLVYSFTVISLRYHLSIAVRYLAPFTFIFSDIMPCTGDYTAEGIDKVFS